MEWENEKLLWEEDTVMGGWEILLGEGGCFMGWWESEEWFWPFKSYSKLKTTICKYWTLIKSKLVWPVYAKSAKVKWK